MYTYLIQIVDALIIDCFILKDHKLNYHSNVYFLNVRNDKQSIGYVRLSDGNHFILIIRLKSLY